MNIRNVVLVFALLFCSKIHADTVTVWLGQSNESYTLYGTGGSAGYGTYLAAQGNCVPGATTTVCTLSGSYTGATPGFSSGVYSLLTTYANADGGFGAISSDPVSSPDGGNYFYFTAFPPDANMSLYLSDVAGNLTVPLISSGSFIGYSFFISAIHSTCTGLPAAVPCTQGNVGLYNGATIASPIAAGVIFDSSLAFLTRSDAASPVPEPEWLALGGLLPGALLVLRRRFFAPTRA